MCSGGKILKVLQRSAACIFLDLLLTLVIRRLDDVVYLIDIINLVEFALVQNLRYCIAGNGSIWRLVSIFSQERRAEIPKHGRATTDQYWRGSRLPWHTVIKHIRTWIGCVSGWQAVNGCTYISESDSKVRTALNSAEMTMRRETLKHAKDALIMYIT